MSITDDKAPASAGTYSTVLHAATDGYDEDMADVPVRELRNDTAGVLRRVQAGEDIVVTVHGVPVARFLPAEESRRRAIPREEFLTRMRKHQADPGLRDLLRELASELDDNAERDW